MSGYNSYFKESHDRLKVKFNKSESIIRNFSQAFQDIFVLSALGGKEGGYYLEIGGDHPIEINNSYLLETSYGWKGLSFEIDQTKVDYYDKIRNNPCICSDATKVDYAKVLKEHQFPIQIDYLQVDIEPSWQTLKALRKLPLDQYRFSVITFETDLYKDGPGAATECHELLREYGYELLVKNVANEGFPYENWYIDPLVVDSNIINVLKNTSDEPKEAINCVLNEEKQ